MRHVAAAKCALAFVVARSILGTDAAVRAYLLEEARDFLHLMVSTLIEDGPESGRFAYDQLSPRVEKIASGAAVHLSRFELPEGHRMSAPGAGHPCDELLLDEHDVLREC